ncbi:MAG: hypothetical protein SFW66_08095 [Gammaproteobacteria bacterium]|nr:hypothetical protein [Gammaproteobacteria bacterium]
MFRRRENYLTSAEIKIIDDAQQKMVVALKKRSLAPADFDTNIEYLKNFEELSEAGLRELCDRHLKQKKKAIADYRTTKYQLLQEFSLSKIDDEEKTWQAIQDRLYGSIREIITEEFSKEPRIINLDVSHNTNKRKDTGVIVSVDKEYTITFSDRTEINLTSLDNKSLAKARIQFDEKMLALAEQNHRLAI